VEQLKFGQLLAHQRHPGIDQRRNVHVPDSYHESSVSSLAEPLAPAPDGAGPRSLADPWTLGGLRIPNRVVLAPLAGIGNWFVRLQAKRYGAGLAVSEMVSSFAIHYRNE